MSDDLSKANNLQGTKLQELLAQLAKHPDAHADGIYFGMPEEEYHRDPALGSSGVRDLMISPLRYWVNSVHNPANQPDDEEEETKQPESAALVLGTYLHDLLLEGGTRPYIRKPKGMSFSTKEGKAWRDAHADFVIIKPEHDATRETMFKALELSGTLARFKGGLPEVSIFWTEKNGHRCKVRIDYLKPDEALDLKTYANAMDKDTETAVAQTIAARRISVQAFWYDRGLQALGRMLHQHGTAAVVKWGVIEETGAGPEMGNPARQLIDAMIARTATVGSDWVMPLYFVFCETGAVPNITARRFVSHDDGELNAYWRWAKMGVQFATEQYARAMVKFGPDQIWVEETYFKELTDEEMASARWVLADE